MTVNLSSLTSATFWTALAGVAALVCGALGVGDLAKPIELVLESIGGLLVLVVGHHTTKAAVAVATAKKGVIVPPVPAP